MVAQCTRVQIFKEAESSVYGRELLAKKVRASFSLQFRLIQLS